MNKFDYIDAEWALGITLTEQCSFIFVVKTIAVEVSNLSLSSILSTSNVLRHSIYKAAYITEKLGQNQLE